MGKFLLVFIISFIVVYLLYLFFVILNKRKNKSVFDTNQASILINLNKLDVNKLNKDVFIQALAISNSFVLAITFAFAVSDVFNSFVLNLILSFIILFVMILVVYKIVGLFLKGRE